MESQEDILKGALLLERRGKAFYEASAASSQDESVREIFANLAREEGRHIDVLAKAFSDVMRTGRMTDRAPDGEPDVAGAVLTQEVMAEISGASYEAGALYAAMALEERAVAFYADAERRSSGEAKALYAWLARWERSHLGLLTALDQELKQKVWNDQRFWPF